jgi:hypothetical protein
VPAEAYRKARRGAFSQAVARLQHASNAAVGTLLRVMTDREVPAASRVRAADVVLQSALRGMEIQSGGGLRVRPFFRPVSQIS